LQSAAAPELKPPVAGRGAAISLVGGYLIAAAAYGNPHEARDVGGVLAALRSGP
jgi:hypothetical protein